MLNAEEDIKCKAMEKLKSVNLFKEILRHKLIDGLLKIICIYKKTIIIQTKLFKKLEEILC